MPKNPNPNALIHESRELLSDLKRAMRKPGILPPSRRKEAETFAGGLESLISLLSRLTNPAVAGDALKEAIGGKHGLKEGATLQEAQHVVAENMRNLIETVQSSHAYETILEATQTLRRGMGEGFEAEGGFLKRAMTGVVEKHHEMLSNRSQLARLTIGNAEILFGSVLALHGLSWIIGSVRGKQVSQHEGEHGTEFHIEAMPLSRKAGGAAAGVAAMAAGLGLTGLGFSAFHH